MKQANEETMKNKSHLDDVILNKKILNHNLEELRNDLLAYYEIRESEVLNDSPREHLPKRELLINRLIEIKLKELEIKQNGKKLFFVILLGIVNLVVLAGDIYLDNSIETKTIAGDKKIEQSF